MPINMLNKEVPKGQKPPGWSPKNQKGEDGKSNEERERDLAIQEQEALWESEEIGIVHWSGEDGKRYSD